MATIGQVSSRTCQPHVFQRNTGGVRPTLMKKPVHLRNVVVQSGLVEQVVQQLAVSQSLVVGAVEVDWSDPDVQIGALGAFLGVVMGIGVPIFYVSRDERDEERLEELRALNRATKEATGEYMTDEEINDIRPARWTDRREFVDDD
jgi:hypothetical protein